MSDTPPNARPFAQRVRGFIARVLLICAFAFIAVSSALLDNTVIGWLPLLVLVVLLALLPLHLFLQIRTLSWREDVSLGDCRRGESVDFAVDVRNKSVLLSPRIEAMLFVSTLTGGADAFTRRTFSLLPLEKKRLVFGVRFDHIGRYEAGLYSLRLTDPFGLFSRTVFNPKRQAVNVLPHIVDISRLTVEQQAAHESLRAAAVVNEGMDYSGIRDYTIGDPLKLIHWKMTARFGEYMSRIYETQVNPTVDILVDGVCEWDDDELIMCCYDAVMESALSFDLYARRNGIESRILLPQKTRTMRSFMLDGSSETADVLSALPRLYPPGEISSLPAMLTRLAERRGGTDNIIVCSANLGRDLTSSVLDFRSSGRDALVVAVLPSELDKSVADDRMRALAPLDQSGVSFLCISQVEDLEAKRV